MNGHISLELVRAGNVRGCGGGSGRAKCDARRPVGFLGSLKGQENIIEKVKKAIVMAFFTFYAARMPYLG